MANASNIEATLNLLENNIDACEDAVSHISKAIDALPPSFAMRNTLRTQQRKLQEMIAGYEAEHFKLEEQLEELEAAI